MTGSRLTTQIQLAALALVAIAGLVLVYVLDRHQRDTVLTRLQGTLEDGVRLNGKRLARTVEVLRQDALFLSRTPPIAGIARAARHRGVDPRDGNAQAVWTKRLQEIFAAFAETHPDYFLVRYIGVADGGRELVRVERRDGKLTVVATPELKPKADRDFFAATLQLEPGEIYLSDFGFDRFVRAAAEPRLRVLRAATPIFDETGQIFGMVVLNLDAGPILDAVSSGLPPGVKAFLTDHGGRYLVHPDPSRTFHFDAPGGLEQDFPGLATDDGPEHLKLRAVAGPEGSHYATAQRVHLDPRLPEHHVHLAYAVAQETIEAEVAATRSQAAVGGILAAALVAFTLMVLVKRLLLSPLRHLNAELEDRVRERTAKLRLAASVFENTSEGVVVTDEEARIVSVNAAFTDITGYEAAEAVGQRPSLLRSDHHDADFYRSLWRQLLETGRWEGEIWNRRKSGEVYLEWLTINRIPAADGMPCSYVSVFNDITERRRKDEHIRHLAFHDALTGLPNRALLQDRLRHAIARAQREGTRLSVTFLDLDRFKAINDTLGHDVGDLLLKEVAARIQARLRESDTFARMGGDEFVILAENLTEPGYCATLAAELIADIARPMDIHGHAIQVGASLGMAFFPEDGDDALTLMKHADTAMYAAKAEGKGTYRFFRSAMMEHAAKRLKLEGELRRAVANGELELHYQPKICFPSGKACSVEALVRWRHPTLGLVPPGDFIPVAEETGLIVDLGAWVLNEVCRQSAEWEEQGLTPGIAFNVSAKQLQDTLVERIVATAEHHGVPPSRLQVELTESLVMADPKKAAAILTQLRAIGVTVAIDDFGTGYSSLAYLRRLPIDVIKIDRSFVMNADRDEDDAQIVRTVIALGQALKLSVVAEGVETEAQAELLRSLGCDVMQGFLYSRPLPAAALLEWLRR